MRLIVVVNHCLSVVLLGVDRAGNLIERKCVRRVRVLYKFGRKFGAKRLDKLDAVFVAQQRPASRIQIRPPVRRAALKRLHRFSIGSKASILPLRDLNSSSVRSLVQRAEASLMRAGGIEFSR